MYKNDESMKHFSSRITKALIMNLVRSALHVQQLISFTHAIQGIGVTDITTLIPILTPSAAAWLAGKLGIRRDRGLTEFEIEDTTVN
jgi:hypothetical protein